mgnify:CR=1 FL=1
MEKGRYREGKSTMFKTSNWKEIEEVPVVWADNEKVNFNYQFGKTDSIKNRTTDRIGSVIAYHFTYEDAKAYLLNVLNKRRGEIENQLLNCTKMINKLSK